MLQRLPRRRKTYVKGRGLISNVFLPALAQFAAPLLATAVYAGVPYGIYKGYQYLTK